jgi:hypothetical protein
LAAALWTPLLVGVAFLLGGRALDLFAGFSRYALAGLAAVVVAIFLLVKVGVPLFTWKGRRRLVGALGRTLRWEFWPPWALYPPILAWIAALAVRHRGLTVFTAANPGIPAGGFIGESKAAILERLDQRWVARFRRLAAAAPAAERLALVRAFAADCGLSPPLVIKPDAGQRGSGVVVARSWDMVEAAVARQEGDALVQEFVPGPEFGVFYVRAPGEERGRIFSITEKRLPAVVGDGRRTLEELVLADDRAVCAARAYFERLAGRLEEVPPLGEVVPLTDLGTHCRGAVFLDGAAHLRAELAAAIEAMARGFDGFHFGRFDLKAPSVEHFRRGEGLKVLELNGVTSEATHIYDPRHGLLHAWTVLARQWTLAFEIGRENRERGAVVEPLSRLLRRLVEFRMRARMGVRSTAGGTP